MSEEDTKFLNSALLLLENAADINGIKAAVLPLCEAVTTGSHAGTVRNNRQAVRSIGECLAKAFSASSSSDENKIETCCSIWDAVFSALSSLLAASDKTQNEPWMMRAFILQRIGMEMTPSQATVDTLRCAEQMSQRLGQLYKLLLDVVMEGSADAGAVAQQRNLQEVRFAVESIASSAFACPSCAGPAVAETITAALHGSAAAGSNKANAAVSAMQQVVAAILSRRDATNKEATTLLLGGLQGASSSMILPSDWDAPLSTSAWSTTASMASQLGTSSSSWVNVLVDRYVQQGKKYLEDVAAKNNKNIAEQQQEQKSADAAPAVAPAPAPKGKKSAAKPKPKPKPKGKGAKKAAKVEEEESEHEEEHHDGEQTVAKDAAAAATTTITTTADAPVLSAKKQVLARGTALVDAFVESDACRGLTLASVCKLFHFVVELSVDVGDLPDCKLPTSPAAASSAFSSEQIKLLVTFWRQVASLARAASHHHSSSGDAVEVQQAFVDACCTPVFRVASAHSVLLLEAVLFVMVSFAHPVKVAHKDVAAPSGADQEDGEQQQKKGGDAGADEPKKEQEEQSTKDDDAASATVTVRELRSTSFTLHQALASLDAESVSVHRALELVVQRSSGLRKPPVESAQQQRQQQQQQQATSNENNNNNNTSNNNNKDQAQENVLPTAAEEASKIETGILTGDALKRAQLHKIADSCRESIAKIKARTTSVRGIDVVLSRVIQSANQMPTGPGVIANVPTPAWLGGGAAAHSASTTTTVTGGGVIGGGGDGGRGGHRRSRFHR